MRSSEAELCDQINELEDAEVVEASTRFAGLSRCLWLFAMLALLAAPVTAHREKTDVITLSNGDRVTGEIKQLELGVLEVKTHLMDTVEIEWVGVESIESQQLFEMETQSGKKYEGEITSGGNGDFVISGPAGSKTLSHDDVVDIHQLGDKARARWSGHVNLGFSLASANTATTFSLDVAATHRTLKRVAKYTLSANYSNRDDADRTWRSQLGTGHQMPIRGNLFWSRFAQLENNQELDLELRVTVGAGVGRYFVRNAHSELSLLGGLLGNRELYYSEASGNWTAEMIFQGSYDFFLFGRRDTSFNTTLAVLPSLSSWGRIRLQLNSAFQRKLLRNLTFTLSLYESYDSDPPSTTAVNNDWGLTTSLGWTF